MPCVNKILRSYFSNLCRKVQIYQFFVHTERNKGKEMMKRKRSSSDDQNEEPREKRFKNTIDENKFYLKEHGADVHFVFHVDSQEVLVPAHKIMLATSSPVFYTMFFGDLPETGNIEIVDASIGGFKDFLKLFYLGGIKITIENVAEITYLCDKYDVAKGINMCERFLLANTKVDELCVHFDLAIKFNLKTLQEFCGTLIRRNSAVIFASDAFNKSDSQQLKAILKLNNHDCSVNELFEACIKWAENACDRNGMDTTDKQNLRRMFDECFYLIPFKSMQSTEFLNLASSNRKMFTIDEVLDIQVFITTGTTTKNTDKFTTMVTPHIFRWDENSLLTCDRGQSHIDPVQVSRDEYTTFSSTQPLLLDGFEFYELSWPSESMIEITIFQRGEALTGDDEDILEKISLFNNATEVVVLNKPIIIQPDLKYTIHVEFKSEFELKAAFYYRQTSYNLQSNVCITFHKDDELNYANDLISIVSKLHFNHL